MFVINILALLPVFIFLFSINVPAQEQKKIGDKERHLSIRVLDLLSLTGLTVLKKTTDDLEADRKNVLSKVEEYLDQGADPNIVMGNLREHHLFNSEGQFNLEVIELLLKRGAKLKYYEEYEVIFDRLYPTVFKVPNEILYYNLPTGLQLLKFYMRAFPKQKSLDEFKKLVQIIKENGGLIDVPCYRAGITKFPCKPEIIFWKLYRGYQQEEYDGLCKYSKKVFSPSSTWDLIKNVAAELRFKVPDPTDPSSISSRFQKIEGAWRNYNSGFSQEKHNWIVGIQQKNNYGTIAITLDPEKKYYDADCPKQ